MYTTKDKPYCARGTREFFRRYGLDWGRFLREGIDAQDLVDTGDAMALRCVTNAREEADGR